MTASEMQVYICVEFSFGWMKLVFEKTYNLPFAPFYGLRLIVHPSYDDSIHLINNNYTSTQIYYDVEEKRFKVYVHNKWRSAVNDDVIDSTIEEFEGWDRLDTTDVDELKKAMEEWSSSRSM